MQRIYLDHNATTPLCSAARDAMTAWIQSGAPTNPSSLHHEGRRARRALEDARDQLADALATTPDRILFTSGATEANDLALRGLTRDGSPPPMRRAVSSIEHPSVIETAEALEKEGSVVERLPVDREGRLLLTALYESLERGASLVSVMAANNETGAIQPIPEIGAACRAADALFHCDGVQWFGKLGSAIEELLADSVALSAHKIGGPPGIGALWLRDTARIIPRLRGGGQERGRRAGTENVIGAIGFGMAAARASKDLIPRRQQLRDLESTFLEHLRVAIPDIRLNGPEADNRLPGTLSLSFPEVFGEPLLFSLDLSGVSASLGSACSSGAAKPSHVLAAMGVPKAENLKAIRFSFGPEQDVDVARVAAERVALAWTQMLSRR